MNKEQRLLHHIDNQQNSIKKVAKKFNDSKPVLLKDHKKGHSLHSPKGKADDDSSMSAVSPMGDIENSDDDEGISFPMMTPGKPIELCD